MTQIEWIYTDKSSRHLFNPDGKNNSLSVMILPTQPLKVISSTFFSPSIRQFLLPTSQAKKQCLQCRLIINSGVWHYHSNDCKVFQPFRVFVRWQEKRRSILFFLDFFCYFFVLRQKSK